MRDAGNHKAVHGRHVGRLADASLRDDNLYCLRFMSFFTSLRNEGGSGLGLPIARSLLEERGFDWTGRIETEEHFSRLRCPRGKSEADIDAFFSGERKAR